MLPHTPHPPLPGGLPGHHGGAAAQGDGGGLLLGHLHEVNLVAPATARYLAQDTKNPMHKMTKKACRSIGILSRLGIWQKVGKSSGFREESFDSRTLKTKTIFVVTQIFYTMLTLVPTPFLFGSYKLRLSLKTVTYLTLLTLAQFCLLCDSLLVDNLERRVLLYRGLLREVQPNTLLKYISLSPNQVQPQVCQDGA